MRVIQYGLAVLAGVAIGVLLSAVYLCVSTRYYGGSLDPRCVYGWKGYVEVHQLDDPKRNSVLCQYRPEVGAP